MMIFGKIFFEARDLIAIVLNWAFGLEKCIVCGKSTVFSGACKDCRKMLLKKCFEVKEDEKRCSVCGKILLSENDFCMSCRNHRVIKSCDVVFPIFPYRLWAKNLMFSWKMLEKRGISSFIARICHESIKSRFCEGEKIIVPVPPRPGKIRKKGWDQVDEMCRILESKYGYEILGLLKRMATVQQKKLDRKQRLDESTERYCLSKKALRMKSEKIPKGVILVDDVMTTGSTVEICARLLKSMGIEKVDVLTVFIVD